MSRLVKVWCEKCGECQVRFMGVGEAFLASSLCSCHGQHFHAERVSGRGTDSWRTFRDD